MFESCHGMFVSSQSSSATALQRNIGQINFCRGCAKRAKQWRLVGFVIEEAGLTEHGNNNTIIFFFLIYVYTVCSRSGLQEQKKFFPFIYILYIHFKIKLNVLTYSLITF
jgi:hypothetical protein